MATATAAMAAKANSAAHTAPVHFPSPGTNATMRALVSAPINDSASFILPDPSSVVGSMRHISHRITLTMAAWKILVSAVSGSWQSGLLLTDRADCCTHVLPIADDPCEPAELLQSKAGLRFRVKCALDDFLTLLSELLRTYKPENRLPLQEFLTQISRLEDDRCVQGNVAD